VRADIGSRAVEIRPRDSVSKQRPNIQTRLNSENRKLFARLEESIYEADVDKHFPALTIAGVAGS
jgi:hypothetical protein